MRRLRLCLLCFALLLAAGCVLGGAAPDPAPPVEMVFPTPAPPPRLARRAEAPRPAPPPASVRRLDQDLQRVVEHALGGEADHYGVVVLRLTDGRAAQLNTERVFYAASLFKLPVMVEVFHQVAAGTLSMDEALVVTESAVEYDLGTLAHDVGEAVTVRQLLEEMITYSDNVAAIMLLGHVAPASIDETLVSLGLDHTSVVTEEIPTTAGDMGRLMELLGRGQVVDHAASEAMLALMRRQGINDRIPQGLPDGVPVAHKTGNGDDATHDAGIVFAPHGAYVLAVLSDLAWENEGIIDLSRAVFRYFEGLPLESRP
ncbi:MAG: serine hydrolase [Dehalococcoidia bacterium]|nr:serine hydrolase [Dehalococcoidia bacterium]